VGRPGVVGPDRALGAVARSSADSPPGNGDGSSGHRPKQAGYHTRDPWKQAYDPASGVPGVVGRTGLLWISRSPGRWPPTQSAGGPHPTTEGTPVTRRRHGCAAMAQHGKERSRGRATATVVAPPGWRNPPMASWPPESYGQPPPVAARFGRTGTAWTIRKSPSTVQAYQSSIPRMTQTALERTGKVRDGAAPPKGRAGTGWR
jgi:hypothetical protein